MTKASLNENQSTGLRACRFIICVFLISVMGTVIKPEHEGAACSLKDFGEVISDLGKHDSFKYLNRDVLTDQFFLDAEESLDDEAVYLILSNTKTAPSRIISIFTENDFNHISLSFDYDLKTMLSYNGGNNRYSPGMNPELIDDLIKENKAHALIYRLELTKEQKQEILGKVKNINSEGSSYNILGLIMNKSSKPNIMYCSQFIYSLLIEVNVFYFNPKNKIKPSDFIEQDYRRELKFCYELAKSLD